MNKTLTEEFNEYKHIKKSPSELESDRIVKDISNKLWNDYGYEVIYNLGAVNCLKSMAQALDNHGYFKKSDILQIISTFKKFEGVSDLVNMILEEFDY